MNIIQFFKNLFKKKKKKTISTNDMMKNRVEQLRNNK